MKSGILIQQSKYRSVLSPNLTVIDFCKFYNRWRVIKVKRGNMPDHVLKNRNFRFLWIATISSASGLAIWNMIIEWLIFTTTQTALMLTLLGVVEFIPMLTIGIFAGAVVDRYSRKRLIILSNFVRTGALALLAFAILLIGFNLIAIFLAVLIISVSSSFFDPAAAALLPSFVKKENLMEGNGLLQSGQTLAGIIGNPLGGILILVVGVASGLIYDSITFAIAAIVMGMLVIPVSIQEMRQPGEEIRKKLMEEVRAGFGFLLSRKALLTMTITSMILNFFSFYQIYIVIYTLDILHSGSLVFGLLVGSAAIGYTVGAALTGRLHFEKRPGIWVPIFWALGGLPLIVLIILPITQISIVSLFFEGFFGGMVNTIWITTIQRIVPDEYLGRCFAIEGTIGYSMIPAGILFGGILITVYGISFAFTLAGVSIFIIGLIMLTNRNIRVWGRN